MGYNTWNDLECSPNEEKLREIANKLKSFGFLELGYQYVTVDDCWMAKKRDPRGRLVGNSTKFPSGMAALGEYLHKLGFKFGIYSSRARHTCAGFPASLGHEEEDAKSFASWGVDLLKNDGCHDPDCGPKQRGVPQSGVCNIEGRRMALDKYRKMAACLRRTGRPIVHSICGWQPWFAPPGHKEGASIGQMWRIGADVRRWGGVYETTRIMEQLGGYHGPNSWNDADMLIGSSAGAKLSLTPVQARAQFSLWAVFATPLMIGASVLQMSDFDRETYSNLEAIRINQDPLGLPAQQVNSNCPAYPRFELSLRADGSPHFRVNRSGTMDSGVSCGAHYETSCQKCPRGHGQLWCNGDCVWENNACVPKDASLEDAPGPWTRPFFTLAEQRQCHQVWVKKLQSDEVAVAAVNYAKSPVALRLDLSALDLPWLASSQVRTARIQDLWEKSPLVGRLATVAGELQLNLEAEGGHSLLRLSPPDMSPMGASNTSPAVRAPGFSKPRPGKGRQAPPPAWDDFAELQETPEQALEWTEVLCLLAVGALVIWFVRHYCRRSDKVSGGRYIE